MRICKEILREIGHFRNIFAVKFSFIWSHLSHAHKSIGWVYFHLNNFQKNR